MISGLLLSLFDPLPTTWGPAWEFFAAGADAGAASGVNCCGAPG